MWPSYKKIFHATNLGSEATYVFRHDLNLPGNTIPKQFWKRSRI